MEQERKRLGLQQEIEKQLGIERAQALLAIKNELTTSDVLEMLDEAMRDIWKNEKPPVETDFFYHGGLIRIAFLTIDIHQNADNEDRRSLVKVTYGNRRTGGERKLEVIGSEKTYFGGLPQNNEEKAVVKTAIKAAFINPEYSQRTKVCSPRIVKM